MTIVTTGTAAYRGRTVPASVSIATITARNLRRLVRVPTLLVLATVQPVLFVLLFTYAFGGAIHVPGVTHYVDYLLPGIFVLAIGFGASQTGVAVAEDLATGMIDRFRSLPISKGAVLGGHAIANLLKALLPITIMSLCGLIVGWRIRTDLAHAVMGYLLMIGFVGAMIWIGILFGSLVKTPEGVQGLGFGVLFPLTFVASTFVPIDRMPKVLHTVAAWNPVTTLADAVRVLFGNPNASPKPTDPWSINHPIAYTVMWIVAIVVICAPMAVRAYQRSIAD